MPAVVQDQMEEMTAPSVASSHRSYPTEMVYSSEGGDEIIFSTASVSAL